MLNTVEFKQASISERENTKKVFVLNQSKPVFVKEDPVFTGDDIIFVDIIEKKSSSNVINIKLSQNGMRQFNEAAKNPDYPMLVFFVNGKSIQVIHKFYEIEEPEFLISISNDSDFAVALTELIKSGVSES